MTTDELRTRTTFHVSSTKNSFFGSQVAGFASNPSCLKYWLLCPFFYKEATCKGSTVKGLPYPAKAAPSMDYFMHLTLTNARKGCWAISPDYRASHSWRFCAVGDVVAQRYDVLCDWLWDAGHMAGVRWGSRIERFCSEEGPHYCLEQSARKLSWNKRQSTLFTSVEIPWGFHTWAVLRSLARPRLCKKVSVQVFCEKERYDLCSVQRTFAPETFGKRRKRGNSPVVRLLPGSHEHLASRNPRVLCQKYGCTCTTY